MDGDGLDDIIFTYSQYIYYMKGDSGEQVNYEYGKAAGNSSIVMDFDGCGKPEILFAGDPGRLALLDNEKHKTIWEIMSTSDINDHSSPVMPNGLQPAVADFDGDGKYEIVMPMVPESENDYLCCYDALTGELMWSEELPQSPYASCALACDIDGDGRLEVIFTVGNVLYCYMPKQDNSGAELKWSLSLPAVCHNPAIADFGKNGGVQIIVMCTDGYVYSVK
ncbi:MAG: VCBS repeat-containing protein [Oscillospiraceae bacterium]|nr:VCBS repeat-containing protein [Oscillospiraceae bacterium]